MSRPRARWASVISPARSHEAPVWPRRCGRRRSAAPATPRALEVDHQLGRPGRQVEERHRAGDGEHADDDLDRDDGPLAGRGDRPELTRSGSSPRGVKRRLTRAALIASGSASSSDVRSTAGQDAGGHRRQRAPPRATRSAGPTTPPSRRRPPPSRPRGSSLVSGLRRCQAVGPACPRRPEGRSGTPQGLGVGGPMRPAGVVRGLGGAAAAALREARLGADGHASRG